MLYILLLDHFLFLEKKFLKKIGPYRHAHTTEDQEIALRMQQNHMKIEHALMHMFIQILLRLRL